MTNSNRFTTQKKKKYKQNKIKLIVNNKNEKTQSTVFIDKTTYKSK